MSALVGRDLRSRRRKEALDSIRGSKQLTILVGILKDLAEDATHLSSQMFGESSTPANWKTKIAAKGWAETAAELNQLAAYLE